MQNADSEKSHKTCNQKISLFDKIERLSQAVKLVHKAAKVALYHFLIISPVAALGSHAKHITSHLSQQIIAQHVPLSAQIIVLPPKRVSRNGTLQRDRCLLIRVSRCVRQLSGGGEHNGAPEIKPTAGNIK
jgi:hypothetical protein